MNKINILISFSLLLLITFTACDNINENFFEENYREKADLIERSFAADITKNLVGSWWIDTLQIKVEYSHPYFRTDTTLTKFGEIYFNMWKPVFPGIESNSFKCEVFLRHNNIFYPIRFEYLMASPNIKEPEKSKLYSFIYAGAMPDGVEKQSNPWDLANYSVLDNVEIVKINDNEYYLRGLNRGMEKMKLRRIR